MKILKIHLKVKYCAVNKDINSQIANGAYNPCKLPRRHILYTKNCSYFLSYAVDMVKNNIKSADNLLYFI
jgi:hypothetical protein